jgi:hypothetical protein
MRRRKYVMGAIVGVIGALVVSSTAFAGVPTGQTLQATVAPKKQSKNTFGPASLHAVIATTFSDFVGTPSPRETIFRIDRQIRLVNGTLPACPQSTLAGATTSAAIQSACSASVVGQGTDQVNNGTGSFPGTNPVVLVSGGPTTLYVWTRIAGGLTLVLNGQYSRAANTLDVTGLPNTPGTDLTNFDITLNKKKSSKQTFYVMARCKSKKKKFVNSETTTFYNGQSITASSKQKCKGVA